MITEIPTKKTRQFTLRFWIFLSAAFIILSSLAVSFALSPGKIEGNYRDFTSCGCDSIQFFYFRSNKVINYATEEHNTAELFGRYEQQPDGSVKFFMTSFYTSEGEKEIYTISPRKLYAKFTYSSTGESSWHFKWPLFGSTKRAIANNVITSSFLHETHKEDITYDSNFNITTIKKTARIPPKTKNDESRREASHLTKDLRGEWNSGSKTLIFHYGTIEYVDTSTHPTTRFFSSYDVKKISDDICGLTYARLDETAQDKDEHIPQVLYSLLEFVDYDILLVTPCETDDFKPGKNFTPIRYTRTP